MRPLRGYCRLMGTSLRRQGNGHDHVVVIEVRAIGLGYFFEPERVVAEYANLICATRVCIANNKHVTVLGEEHRCVKSVISRNGPGGAFPEIASPCEGESVIKVVCYGGPECIGVAISNAVHTGITGAWIDVELNKGEFIDVVGIARKLDIKGRAVFEIEQGIIHCPLSVTMHGINCQIVVRFNL